MLLLVRCSSDGQKDGAGCVQGDGWDADGDADMRWFLGRICRSRVCWFDNDWAGRSASLEEARSGSRNIIIRRMSSWERAQDDDEAWGQVDRVKE